MDRSSDGQSCCSEGIGRFSARAAGSLRVSDQASGFGRLARASWLGSQRLASKPLEGREMVAETAHLTTGKSTVDPGPDNVSSRHASGQLPVESSWADVPCAFCQGTGKDPFGIMSWVSTCCVCSGKGTAQVRGPQERCAHCRGTGAVKTLTCTTCGGKGVAPSRAVGAVKCPECQGTGDDISASALACLTCRGRGWVELDE
jgi:DnaJ-class molecular chaperone